MPYKERLGKLGLLIWEQRCLQRHHLTAPFSNLYKGITEETKPRLFTVVQDERKRATGTS